MILVRCAIVICSCAVPVLAATPLLLSVERDVPERATIRWPAVTGRSYGLSSGTTIGEAWLLLATTELPKLATTTQLAFAVETSQPAEFFQVEESPSPYDPPWESIAPLRTIAFIYNASLSSDQNGANLKIAIQSLIPGDKLEIGAGTYSINSFTAVNLQGTAAAPIWIEAAPAAGVIITRPDANQNLINVGSGAPARYLCLRRLEFVGGSHGVRLFDCANVWIDQCKIRDTGDVGLSANAHDTDHLYLTRNEIWNTGGTGEGMYLGGNNASVIMSESIIALNHVHDTDEGVLQGDGIEVKQGSWGNVIAANRVHDCNYPCILVYGTAGKPRNVVEHNICYRSNDNAMQIQGECIVRNNLVIAGGANAFASQPHQGDPTRMTVVHNTFVNTGTAVRLVDWGAGEEMVFANNACYSQSGNAINAVNGSVGVSFNGNVACGAVTGGIAGFQIGTGMTDFVSLSWDGVLRDAHPSGGSPLRSAADPSFATGTDLLYFPRSEPHIAGCHGR